MEGGRGTQAEAATRQLKKGRFGDILKPRLKRRSTSPIENRALTLVSASYLRWPYSCNMDGVILTIVATCSGFVYGRNAEPLMISKSSIGFVITG
jgi:hypothetical protein